MKSRFALQVLVLAALSGIPFVSAAQEQVSTGGGGDQASIQTERLTPDQLADLVAPIALYPDPLLSQVLVASTYPLEVVEAQQWLDRNENLEGQRLTDAAREQDWDASVQGLVAFPDVLAMLNRDVQWTEALGNAFLAQRSEVMAAVQRLRARAKASGRLSSTLQQVVTTESENGLTAIDIAPADPQVIYVPQYDPAYVWGPPAWGYYPSLPYYWGYGFGPAIDIGFCFGSWPGWAWGWGWGPNWFGGSVYVNGPFFRHYGYHCRYLPGGHGGRGDWHHDPGHRHGVSYPDRRVAARYNAGSMASRNLTPRPGNWNRTGAGTGPGSGNRTIGSSSRYAGSPRVSRAPDAAWRTFRGTTRGQVPTRRSAAPTQRFSAPTQRYSAPSQRSSAPGLRYQPSPRYQSAWQYRSAPRGYSPTSGGRSFGGAGSSHGFAGGGARGAGGGFSPGGGSHGGGHRR